MEVDFFNGDVVDFCFGGAEQFECVNCSLFYWGGGVCRVDQVADDSERAAVGVFVIVGVGMFVGMTNFVLVLRFGVVLMGVGMLFVRVIVMFFGKLCAFVDVNLAGGDAAAVNFFDPKGGVEVQGSYGFVEDFGIDSCVDEGPEKHIAADAGEAVEIGDAHGTILSCSLRGLVYLAG